MKLPKQVVIAGKSYRIDYTADMVKTDIDQRSALWGQVDYHTRTIRVYVGKDKHKRQPADILETLLHEIIHAILADNKMLMAAMKDGMNESFTDTLGVQLADTLTRNGLVRLTE